MTTKVEIPLGKVEDEHLEFKSRAVLEHPETIGREVVAMLNADGGEIWIGVREEGGRAMEIEPIEDAESARERLRDHLVDSLEPAVRHDEVRIELVDLPEGGEDGGRLLRIEVIPRERGPYAFVRSSAWHYPRRVGARLRPMTREEIHPTAPADTSANKRLEAARTEFVRWRDDERRRGAGLWLGLWPVPPLLVKPQDSLFDELQVNPLASGNRQTGFTFVRSLRQPEVTAESINWGVMGDRDYQIRSEFFSDGRAAFFASFETLGGEEEREIWPRPLIEYPISALRIAARIYGAQRIIDFQVLADLSLFDVEDRGLRPGSPGSLRFRTQMSERLKEDRDILFERPLVFSRDEVVDEPDRCGFRLLRRVYQAFGYNEDDIPPEYDRRTGRLILSE